MKILLLGDSIRMGYCTYVREMLAGKAEVLFPEENGRFLQYTLRQLQDWRDQLNAADADIVHWNNGLWDCAHLGVGSGNEAVCGSDPNDASFTSSYEEEQLTPPDLYAYMLERVYRRIRTLLPQAEIIFALTTPVLEEQAPATLARYNLEIQHYNAIACKALEKYSVRINDLYAFSNENLNSFYRDWVHFNEEGSKLLALEICRFLKMNCKCNHAESV